MTVIRHRYANIQIIHDFGFVGGKEARLLFLRDFDKAASAAKESQRTSLFLLGFRRAKGPPTSLPACGGACKAATKKRNRASSLRLLLPLCGGGGIEEDPRDFVCQVAKNQNVKFSKRGFNFQRDTICILCYVYAYPVLSSHFIDMAEKRQFFIENRVDIFSFPSLY